MFYLCGNYANYVYTVCQGGQSPGNPRHPTPSTRAPITRLVSLFHKPFRIILRPVRCKHYTVIVKFYDTRRENNVLGVRIITDKVEINKTSVSSCYKLLRMNYEAYF